LSIATAVSQNTGLQIDSRALRDLEGRHLEKAIVTQTRAIAQSQARARTLAQVQARSGIEWSVPETLMAETDERALIAAVTDALDRMLAEHMGRLAEEIDGEIEARVRRPTDCQASEVLRLLEDLRFGMRSGFDRQHRRVSQRVERFQFAYWVADQIQGWERDHLVEEILTHLQDALNAWEAAWGQLEMQRVNANRLSDLDADSQAGLERALGQERFAGQQGMRIAELEPDDSVAVQKYLGQRVMFNVQRQLMLDITSRYWVEHLTSMEVLRQGIGLQSYAQKDPLAEYKVRAYDMFQELLQVIQSDVVTAMFTYRPRDLSQVRVGVERKRRIAPASAQPADVGEGTTPRAAGRPPRRRKRR